MLFLFQFGIVTRGSIPYDTFCTRTIMDGSRNLTEKDQCFLNTQAAGIFHGLC